MNHKKSAKILKICGLIGAILVVVCFVLLLLSEQDRPALLTPALVSLFAGAVVVIVGAIQAGIYMRCPHCDKSLYSRSMPKPAYCPHCGKPVEW